VSDCKDQVTISEFIRLIDMNSIDLGVLQRFFSEVCDNETEILAEIASDCIQETDSLAKQIHNAYAVRDWELFNRSAHSMKSTSRSLGGVELSKHAETLEHLSLFKTPQFDPKMLTEPVSMLNPLVRSFIDDLRNEVAKLGASI